MERTALKINAAALEKKFGEWFTKEKRWTFFLSILTGILTHFILLTDGMMSQDGLCKSIRYYSEDFDLSIGRWGIRIFEPLRANYTVVYLSAVVSILMMAVSTVLLVSLLRIRSVTGAVITGMVLSVSPALTATLLHEYVSDLYFLALVFILIASLGLVRCGNKILGTAISIVFTVLSLSLYQSYIGIEAGLAVIVTILALLKTENPVKEALKSFLRYLITVIAGLFAYLLVTMTVQTVTGVSAGAYGGLNQLTPGGILLKLPESFVLALRSFLRYFIRDDYIYNTSWHRDVFYLLFFISFGALLVFALLRKKIYRNPGRLIFLILLLLLYPAAVNVIQLIIPGSEIYMLTSVQMLLVVPFFFALGEEAGDFLFSAAQLFGTVMLLIITATYFMADVLSYRALKERYDQSLAVAGRILNRMEETEGYDRSMPVAFAGWINDENYPPDGSYFPYTLGPLVTGPLTHGDYYPNTESIRRFYLQFFGEQLTVADPGTFTGIIGTKEFQDMSIFPGQDSVQVIDGVLVVKLMNDPWPPY